MIINNQCNYSLVNKHKTTERFKNRKYNINNEIALHGATETPPHSNKLLFNEKKRKIVENSTTPTKGNVRDEDSEWRLITYQHFSSELMFLCDSGDSVPARSFSDKDTI